MILKRLSLSIAFGIGFLGAMAHNDGVRLGFTENKGQLPKNVLYHSKLHIGDIYLEKNRFTFDMYSAKELDYDYALSHNKNSLPTGSKPLEILNKHAYTMMFEGANANPKVSSEKPMEGYYNYYIGNDPSKWASNVYSYRKVRYGNIYNGIDLEIYALINQLKYDFIVQPGADVNQIAVKYGGVTSLKLVNGDLVIELSNGEIKEAKPFAYQEHATGQDEVPCRFRLVGNTLTFEFPDGYDATRPLIVDPTWVFSSLTGSTADNWGFTATYDLQGHLYGGGIAFSNGYPTTVGAYQTTFSGSRDITISKYSPTGNTLIYSTYLGGTAAEVPHSLVVDSQNNLIVMGSTGSSNYPTTGGAYDVTFNGGTGFTGSNGVPYTAGADIIITKFNPTGTALLASTFVGGSGNDGISQNIVYNYSDEVRGEVFLDANDNIVVTTSTRSTNFPTTAGSHSQTNSGNQDAVVFKMNPTLSTLMWSTYYGGSGNDAGYSVRVAPNGNVYICGGTASTNLSMIPGGLQTTYAGGSHDGYIAGFDGNNGTLLATTYLGTNSYDQCFILEIDQYGDVYTVGQTLGAYGSANAAYTVGNSAQFIHKLNPTLTTTVFKTLFGDGARTTIDISPTAFLVDLCGNIYVSGWGGNTNSGYAGGSTNGLPTTTDAIKLTTDGSDFYFIVIERNAQSLLYGSYFGSNSAAEHVDGGTSRFDPAGTIYQAVCAGCGGNNFPTTPGVWATNNGSTNCNLGAIKINFEYQGLTAGATPPPDVTLCDAPYSVDFTAGGTPPPHNFWNFGDGVGTSTQADPTYVYASPGVYDVMYVAIDSSTCNIRDTAYFQVTIIQPDPFVVNFTVPPFNPCDGLDSLMVDFEFSGSGVDSLIWNMGNGDIFYNITDSVYYYTNQGNYVLTMIAMNSLCNYADTVTVPIDYILNFTLAEATAPEDVVLCGQPFNVDFETVGTAPPNSYWDFGDGTGTSILPNVTYAYADSGSYTVMYVAIDSSTCNIADTVYFNVTLIIPPVFNAQFDIPIVEPCTSVDSLLVEFAFTGTGADSLIWNMGNGTIFTNADSVSYYYLTQGVYQVSLIAFDLQCGEIDTLTATVNYTLAYTTAQADAPDDIFLCAQPLNVDFTAGPTPPPHSFWDFGDGNTSTQHDPTHTYALQGNYTVMYVAIDSSTCNIADSVYFNVTLVQAETFSAQINFTPPDPCSGDSLFVNAAFTGSGADAYIWDMGNGDVFNTDSIAYVYTVPGTYTLSFTAIDNLCNHTETINQTINFIPNIASVVQIPNVFTPNGDGVNDVFQTMDVDGTAEYYMVIFNRWGRKVFETDDSTVFWNGSIQQDGSEAAGGVYFYEVRFTDLCKQEEIVKNGFVTLVR